MAFDAGAVVSRLELGIQGWKKSVDTVKQDQKSLGGMSDETAKKFRMVGAAVTAAGVAITATFGKMIKDYVKAGDEVHKMALRTGFATETLSELRYVAEISGTNISSLETATKRMSRTLMDAADGTETAKDALARLNLTYDDLRGLSPEEQFLKIGYAIADLEDPTEKSAAALEIFGRAGTELLPMFAEGAAGIDALRQKARDMGIVFDRDAANAAARLADAQTTLKASMAGLSITIAEKIVPTVSAMVEKIAKAIESVTKWAKENPQLSKTLTIVVAAAGALMMAIGPFLIALPGLVIALGAVTTAGLLSAGALGAIAVAATTTYNVLNDLIKAKERLAEADYNAFEANEKLGKKLREAADAAGMSRREFNALAESYDRNYAAMGMAIHRGKEGVELQKALAEVGARSNLVIDEQRAAIDARRKAEEDAALATASAAAGIKEQTLAEKLNIVTKKKLQDEIDDIAKALKLYAGQIPLDETKRLKDRMDELNARLKKNYEVIKTVTPAARHMGEAFRRATTPVESAAYAIMTMEEKIKRLSDHMKLSPATIKLVIYEIQRLQLALMGIHAPEIDWEKVKNGSEDTVDTMKTGWEGMFTSIAQKWGQTIKTWMEGDMTFKTFREELWEGMKETFFTMVGEMATKWIVGFIEKAIKGTEDLAAGMAKAGESASSMSGALTTAFASALLSILAVMFVIYAFFDWLGSHGEGGPDFYHPGPDRGRFPEKPGPVRPDTGHPRRPGGQNLTGFAEGGIAWNKQLAWVAEKGPEMIIPLKDMKGAGAPGGITVNLSINGTMITDREWVRTRLVREFTDALQAAPMQRNLQRALGISGVGA